MRWVSTADTFCTIMSMLMSAAATASEDASRLADHVGHPDDGDLGLAAVVCDARDDRLLHLASFLPIFDPGAVLVGERGPDMHLHMLTTRVLHTTQVQDLGPARCHLQHRLVRDPRHPPRARHDPRVGGEHTVDIGVDLTVVGTERCRQRDRGGVRRAPSQGGDVLGVLRHAWKPATITMSPFSRALVIRPG